MPGARCRSLKVEMARLTLLTWSRGFCLGDQQRFAGIGFREESGTMCCIICLPEDTIRRPGGTESFVTKLNKQSMSF